MHDYSSSLGCDNILPNYLDPSHVSFMFSQPSFSSEFYFDMPLNNSVICDSNVDLHRTNNMFDMLSGQIDNFLSLGYLSGSDASLDLYCIYLMDKPKKIM